VSARGRFVIDAADPKLFAQSNKELQVSLSLSLSLCVCVLAVCSAVYGVKWNLVRILY